MAENSAGKKLSTARLARGLSIDEAAHATKMRPDKILALENDDFSRFGSPAYAKGFLMMYSRFLRVDVSEQLREFDNVDNRVNVEEYQYLSNVPEPEKTSERIPLRALERRRQPSIIPLLIFMMLLGLAGFGYWVFIGVQRLGLDKPSQPSAQASTPAPVEAAATPTPAPQKAPIAMAPERGPDPAVEALPPKSELVVEPVKTTWVRIRLDSKDAKPAFEGDVYPWGPPLKISASRFYVEVRDEASVKIRNNGRQIAYHPPGITVP